MMSAFGVIAGLLLCTRFSIRRTGRVFISEWAWVRLQYHQHQAVFEERSDESRDILPLPRRSVRVMFSDWPLPGGDHFAQNIGFSFESFDIKRYVSSRSGPS